MCIIYFWKLYFSKDFPKRDIKLFLIGGENEFSISFKITYSILIYCIIQVFLKGGEIVHKFINPLISPIYIFFKIHSKLYSHMLYIMYFWNSKKWILFLKYFRFLRIHTLKNKGGETIFAYITFKSMFFIYIPLLRGTNCFWKFFVWQNEI